MAHAPGDMEQQLEEIAAEYVDHCRGSTPPDIEEYAQRYPDLAEEIRDLFPTIARIEGLKHDSGSSSTRRAVAGLTRLERLGDFRIIREIGRGGMGVVYEAEQLTLRRRVALKVLGANVAATERQLARFRREAEAAARLHHTNIVPVYGTGEDQGVCFFAMQYIDGWTLADVIARLGRSSAREESRSTELVRVTPDLSELSLPLPPDHETLPATSPGRSSPPVTSRRVNPDSVERAVGNLAEPLHAARLVADLANAVSYAHQQGVLHRDLKPSNILVDRQGVGWLVDFGLARHETDSSLTHTGDAVGTIQYMAPEQFAGRFDAKSDVYSLGLTLYELLTLTPAYDTTPQATLIKEKLANAPRPVRLIAANVPRDLETIAMKACALDPDHRYATAAEFAADLERFCNDEPIQARRITLVERFWRWSKRNQAVSALTSLTLLLLLGVILAFAIGRHRTNLALLRVDEEKRLVLREQQRAQANLNVAIGVLDEIMANVAERGVPRTLRLAVDGAETQVSDVAITSADAALLRSLLQFYDKFSAENDADLTSESARALARIGDIEMRLGHLDRAAEAFHSALSSYEKLRKQKPDDQELKQAETSAWNQLGVALAVSGDISGAIDAHRKARDLLQSADPETQPAKEKFELAQTLMLLGTVGARAGAREMFAAFIPKPSSGGRPGPHPPMARPRLGPPPGPHRGHRREPPPHHEPPMLPDLREAYHILKRLTASDPQNPEYRLAYAQCELSILELKPFSRPGAKPEPESGQSAEKILRELVAENPDSPKYLFELAEALCVRARLWDPFTPEERQAHLVEAASLAERLTTAYPRISAYQALAARVERDLAVSYKFQGRTDEAEAHLETARSIQKQLADENPTSAFYQVAWAQMLVEWSDWQFETGDRDAGADTLREALKIAERSAPSWGDDPFFQGYLELIRERVDRLSSP